MGGCLSSNSPSKPHRNSKSTPHSTRISKSPPPSILEEETVKEVLSETPSGRAQPIPQPDSGPFIKNAPLLLRDFSRKNANALRDHRNGVVFKKAFGAADDVVSEDCSTLGESETASAAAPDDPPRYRSPAKRKNASPFSGEARRERTAVGRSPSRRPEPPPSPNRDRPGSGNVRRREGGESSGRRSRSPVTRADSGNTKSGTGRSASARRSVKSPGRVGSGLGERIRNVDGERKDGGGGDGGRWPPTTGDESLENPLVSLECFIFL